MTYYGISGAARAAGNKTSGRTAPLNGVKRAPARITPAVPSTAKVNGRNIKKNSTETHVPVANKYIKRSAVAAMDSISADTVINAARRKATAQSAPAVRTRTNTVSGVKARPLPKARVRVKYIDTAEKAAPMPVHLICGAIMITLLFLFFVFNCVQLNEYNAQTVQLKKQINDYTQQYVSLEKQLEQREDLGAIEQRAISMGMIKKDLLPRKYVSVIDGDKIEVIEDTSEQGGVSTLLSGISNTILNIKEYLNG